MGNETRATSAESEADAGPEGSRQVEPRQGVTSEERQPTGPGTEHPTDGGKRGDLGEAGDDVGPGGSRVVERPGAGAGATPERGTPRGTD